MIQNERLMKKTKFEIYNYKLWYISSYTIMTRPIKSSGFHYPMIQFLINCYVNKMN